MINELQEMLKNKIEFKELDVETKKIYVDKIEELNNRVYNYIYQENMFMQDEELNNMNIKNYVEVKDHYSSFYLVCNDCLELIKNIDKDYLNNNNLILYNELYSLYNKLIELDEDSEEYEKLYEKIEEKTNNFVNGITDQLREYETVDYSLINEYIEYNDEFINDNMFSNLYIDPEELKNNIYKIYNISINYNIYI